MSRPHSSEPYRGFEQGVIRPPSEARSLLLRVTRNCPWNRCSFCPVYKAKKFSIRPVAHVKRDIDAIHRHVATLRDLTVGHETASPAVGLDAARELPPDELPAFQAAYHWLTKGGMRSVFLQDANSLAVKPDHLLEILRHLQARFPEVERVTSYARSPSLVRLQPDVLSAFRAAGLKRIHIGLESGADQVLARVQKGATKEMHIQAGRLVKDAGIELSEYYMPGLGGRDLTRANALETADALNRIDPDFIRLRSLAIPGGIPLYTEYQEGAFAKCSDVEVQEEILLCLENLDGITSKVRSDHILNLLPEIHGRLPEDRDHMCEAVRNFLGLDPRERLLYQVGRRLGIFDGLRDMQDESRRGIATVNVQRLGITPENCDQILDDLMRQFV